MADVGNCNFNGCAQTTSGKTFANLSPDPQFDIDVPPPLATVGFDFTVAAGSVGGDMTTVFDFSGSETISVNPTTGLETVNTLTLSQDGILQGLEKLEPGRAGSALGYAWDASDISVVLNRLVAGGLRERHLHLDGDHHFARRLCYERSGPSASSDTRSFGDPIGRGGGVSGTNAILGGGNSLLAAFSLDGDLSSDPIKGVNFGSAEFNYPFFDPATGTVILGAVPEPKTWMSLILGFGLVGAALRRRRVLSYS